MIRIFTEKSSRKFRSATPLFGTKNKPRPLRDQQVSPYYWWWAYLKQNKQYIACCERNGKGKLAKLYADFGDVRGDDFKSWWTSNERGRELFSEPISVDRVKELQTKEEWLEAWDASQIMVIALPLDWSKRDLQKGILRLLRKRHNRKPGKRALKGRETSDAKYPLSRNCNVHALKVGLSVYEAVQRRASNGKKQTYDAIGISLKLVPTAMPTQQEMISKKRSADSVNSMTVAVSRHYKRAKTIIENVGKGVFP